MKIIGVFLSPYLQSREGRPRSNKGVSQLFLIADTLIKLKQRIILSL